MPQIKTFFALCIILSSAMLEPDPFTNFFKNIAGPKIRTFFTETIPKGLKINKITEGVQAVETVNSINTTNDISALIEQHPEVINNYINTHPAFVKNTLTAYIANNQAESIKIFGALINENLAWATSIIQSNQNLVLTLLKTYIITLEENQANVDSLSSIMTAYPNILNNVINRMIELNPATIEIIMVKLIKTHPEIIRTIITEYPQVISDALQGTASGISAQ